MAETTHLYSVGTVVMCDLVHGLNGKAACSIVKLMPPTGTQMQYRIKYTEEKFERVVTESQLTAVAA